MKTLPHISKCYRHRQSSNSGLTTMATADVTQLKSRVRQQVPIEASGRVSIEALANAIIGRRPG